MGIRNKERRRTSKQHREARDHTRATKFAAEYTWGGATGRNVPPSPYLVDMMLQDAAHASCERRDAASVLADLTDRDAGPAWCALVTARVATALIDPLTTALHAGWEPRDISAFLRRKAGASASDLVAAVLPEALPSRRPDTVTAARWEAQVKELAAGARRLDTASPTWEADICSALGALGILSHLGVLPDLTCPTQPAGRPDLDPSLLNAPLAEIVAGLSLSDELVDALLSQTGILGDVLADVRAWEFGGENFHLRSGTSPALMERCYLQALAWATDVCGVLDLPG